jgi:hypothetical protein
LIISVIRVNVLSLDSIVVDLELKNQCNDSTIIMLNYSTPRFYFPNGSIQPNLISGMPLYPYIDWEKSSKGAKEIYIKNRCNPLIQNYDILIIPPKDSRAISYNFIRLGYKGFTTNVKYDFFVAFDVSDQLTSYCPFVWSGYSQSPKYSFTINQSSLK